MPSSVTLQGSFRRRGWHGQTCTQTRLNPRWARSPGSGPDPGPWPWWASGRKVSLGFNVRLPPRPFARSRLGGRGWCGRTSAGRRGCGGGRAPPVALWPSRPPSLQSPGGARPPACFLAAMALGTRHLTFLQMTGPRGPPGGQSIMGGFSSPVYRDALLCRKARGGAGGAFCLSAPPSFTSELTASPCRIFFS